MGNSKQPIHEIPPSKKSREERIDKTLENSFPASDPPSWTAGTLDDIRPPNHPDDEAGETIGSEEAVEKIRTNEENKKTGQEPYSPYDLYKEKDEDQEGEEDHEEGEEDYEEDEEDQDDDDGGRAGSSGSSGSSIDEPQQRPDEHHPSAAAATLKPPPNLERHWTGKAFWDLSEAERKRQAQMPDTLENTDLGGRNFADATQGPHEAFPGEARTQGERVSAGSPGDTAPYAQWNSRALYEKARQLNIFGRSRMSKTELIEAIAEAERSVANTRSADRDDDDEDESGVSMSSFDRAKRLDHAERSHASR